MKLTIELTEEILDANPELAELGWEAGQSIDVEFKGDRPPTPPHNG